MHTSTARQYSGSPPANTELGLEPRMFYIKIVDHFATVLYVSFVHQDEMSKRIPRVPWGGGGGKKNTSPTRVLLKRAIPLADSETSSVGCDKSMKRSDHKIIRMRVDAGLFFALFLSSFRPFFLLQCRGGWMVKRLLLAGKCKGVLIGLG